MKKKFKSIIIIILVIIINPIFVNALTYPEIDSKILEIYDLTDKKIIYEIDSNKQASIASLTKIATTITAIENINNLDEEVLITSNILSTVRWDASKAGLKAGDKLTYRDLLYASMLPSGADATNSIAILSTGSVENFVKKMNELAERIGLKNTHFVNVTGLDAEGHYSTADEVRKLLSYALENELFRKIYTTREYTLSNGLTVYSTIVTYNKNSSVDTSKIIGSKTGYTGEAGYCLSSISDINSHEFIIIVLDAEHKNNKYYNIVDTVNLITFLLENYKEEVIVKKDTIIKTIPVKLSKEEKYEIRAQEDIKLFLPSDYDKEKIKIEYNGLDELSFINKEKTSIGKVTYYYDDKLVAQEKFTLESKFNISIIKIIKEYYYVFISIIILFLIVIINKLKKKKRKK